MLKVVSFGCVVKWSSGQKVKRGVGKMRGRYFDAFEAGDRELLEEEVLDDLIQFFEDWPEEMRRTYRWVSSVGYYVFEDLADEWYGYVKGEFGRDWLEKGGGLDVVLRGRYTERELKQLFGN